MNNRSNGIPLQSLAQKVGWSASASICNMSGRLLVQVMLARMLGPEGMGKIAYIVWLIEVANLLVCFGLPSTLTRYLSELHSQQKTVEAARFAQWVFVRYLLLALTGSVVVAILFFYSSQYKGLEAALPVLSVLFLARGLESINHADLAGRQRFDLLARVNGVATLALAIGVGVGAYGFGVIGALYGYVGGAMVPALYSFTILRSFSFHQKVPENLRRRVWKFAINTWLALLVSAFVWSRMEIYFLERYWNAHEVAMFTVALTFAQMVQQVSALFSGSFMAHFSHLLGKGNQDLVQRQYESSTRLMAFMVVPMAFGGAAIMPTLLPLLFGGEFAPAVPNAMVLTATAGMAFSTIGSSLVYAKERSDFICMCGFVGAVLSVAAGFWVVSRFGAWGAVWARMIVQSLMIVLGTWFIVKQLHFSYPFGSLGRTALAGTFCALAAWSIIHSLPYPILMLSFAVPLGAVVYAFSAKFLHVLGIEEVRQLKRATSRLPAGIHKYFCLTLDTMVTKP